MTRRSRGSVGPVLVLMVRGDAVIGRGPTRTAAALDACGRGHTPEMSDDFRTCDHDLIKRDADTWQSLRLVGVQQVEADENGLDAHELELRNCPCGTTLALRLPGAR